MPGMALVEAHNDLKEAAELDPGNSHIRQQKDQVETT